MALQLEVTSPKPNFLAFLRIPHPRLLPLVPSQVMESSLDWIIPITSKTACVLHVKHRRKPSPFQQGKQPLTEDAHLFSPVPYRVLNHFTEILSQSLV
jgi:hypothetical protein